jgi:hypothetical protein
MGEAIAYYDPGADITCQHVSGNVGGRCVGFPTARQTGGPSGISDTGLGVLIVDNPAANTQVFGVTSHDVAVNGYVNIMRAPKVVPVECSAGVVIGDYVTTGADGRIAKSTTGQAAVGRALSAGALGTFAAVLLFPGNVAAP